MKKLQKFLEERMLPIAGKLGTIKGLIAIRDGIVLAMPLIIIGSIFLILTSLPITGYDDFIASLSDGTILEMMNHTVNATFGIMGIVAAFGIGKSMADQYKVDGLSAGVLSLAAWLVLTPNIITDEAQGIPITYVGSRGLFVAIVVGLLSGLVFQYFVNKEIVIKMPEQVPPAVSQSFVALVPGTVIIISAFVVRVLLEVTNLGNVHDLLLKIFGGPLGLLGGTLGGTIIAVCLNSLFWFAGIHGGNMVGSIMNPIWLMNTDANRLAYQAGKEVPHIITTQFTDMFVYLGGGGATLALVTILFIFAKSQQGKVMGRLSFVPGLFNINEPAMFGIPIVFNMSLLIPFVLVPIVNVFISYFAIASGLVSKTIGVAVPWTMPPIISGFLATGDISGSILQIVLIIVDIALYYPFFKILDNTYLAEEIE